MELRSGVILEPPPPIITLPTQEAVCMFDEAVRTVFRQWTALRLAVENEWGGQNSAEKAENLRQEVLAWFQKKGRKWADELEDLLDEGMIGAFNAEIEDGSLQEVSEVLLEAFGCCTRGDYAALAAIRRDNAGGPSRQVDETAMAPTAPSDTSRDVDMEVEGMVVEAQMPSTEARAREPPVSNLTAEEVAEGWEEVPQRRKGGRRAT